MKRDRPQRRIVATKRVVAWLVNHDYDAVEKPARDAYRAAVKPAQDAYYAVQKPARDKRDKRLREIEAMK